MSRKKAIIIYPHIHWDIEWYSTSEEFRVHLVKTVSRIIELLEKGALKSFTLDGQSVLLDEIKVVNSRLLSKIKDLASKGLLEIGPWYTQPDLYLVCGESIIRNLLIGMIESNKFGGCLNVVYVPDTFGHPSQMPQIIKGFNINVYVFSRGNPLDVNEYGSEFIWEAPDGSKVLAVFLPLHYSMYYTLWKVLKFEKPPLDKWYAFSLSSKSDMTLALKMFFEGVRSPKEILEKYLDYLIKVSLKYSNMGIVIVPLGDDHQPPRSDISDIYEIISKLSKKYGVDAEYHGLKHIGNIGRYKNVTTLKTFSGELRSARYRNILWGVLTSRITVKQLNHLAETLLLAYVEPLSVLRYILLGDDIRPYIRYMWKLLLRVHFHDVICGTGSDKVYMNTVRLLHRVIESANSLILDSMINLAKLLCNNSRRSSVIIYNPVPYETYVPTYVIMRHNMRDVNRVSIKLNDTLIPLQLVEEMPLDFKKYVFINKFSHMSVQCAEVIFNNSDVRYISDLNVQEFNVIENEYIKLIVETNGAITLIDKRNGREYRSMNIIVDYGDVGDSYDYEPTVDNVPISSKNIKADIELVETGPHRAVVNVRYKLSIPKEAIGKSRSKETVEVPIEVRYIMYSRTPRVDVEVFITNTAKDHTVRVAFPLPTKAKIVRELHFEISEIGKLPAKVKFKGTTEYEPQNIAIRDWIGVFTNQGGFIIATKGLHEVFLENNRLELTLFRTFNSISKDNLTTREGHAGPALPTPKAQYLNEQLHFEYCILPLTEDDVKECTFIKHIESYIKPAIGIHINSQGNAEKSECIHVKMCYPYLRLKPPLMLSALKLREEEMGEGIIIRIFNPTEKYCTLDFAEMLKLFDKEIKIYKALSSERELNQMNEMKISIQPYRIETFLIKCPKQ